MQSCYSVASDCGVGELGGQQLQGVLYVHRPPLTKQLQSLLSLLGKVPVHTLKELCQGLQQEGENEEEKEAFNKCNFVYVVKITKGTHAYLLLCSEVVSELPHQVLLFRGQLLGWRVAHNYLLVLKMNKNQLDFSDTV